MFFNEPKIILADEPTSNLDILNSKKVFDFLQKYKSKRLIFVAIHDLNNASEFDHIFTINKEQKSIIEIPNDEFNMDNLTKYYHE
ncbi:hypothetical protein [Mycoplasmopsis cynos]|uniref:hypothetical protein n=1 Tax=Mycoplasmopsis cynos TaxID=171284 RepID=UPI002200B803|nr:hypothetical protein [Mycoplasmopsis cynos]UWV81345.1 hypothetical protein NW065_05345 [Mycoplasmopsis cynos]